TFLAAPAVGDIDGDGKPDVVVGSTDYHASSLKGAIDAFLGNGQVVHRFYNDEIVAPPVIADVNGQGPSEVIAGDGNLEVLDGALNLVEPILPTGPPLAHKSAAAVGELGPAGGRWSRLVSTPRTATGDTSTPT